MERKPLAIIDGTTTNAWGYAFWRQYWSWSLLLLSFLIILSSAGLVYGWPALWQQLQEEGLTLTETQFGLIYTIGSWSTQGGQFFLGFGRDRFGTQRITCLSLILLMLGVVSVGVCAPNNVIAFWVFPYSSLAWVRRHNCVCNRCLVCFQTTWSCLELLIRCLPKCQGWFFSYWQIIPKKSLLSYLLVVYYSSRSFQLSCYPRAAPFHYYPKRRWTTTMKTMNNINTNKMKDKTKTVIVLLKTVME